MGIKKRGFTLIEIIVAIAILAIIAVAFLNAFTQGFTTVFSAGNESKAMSDAQTYVDRVWNAGENGDITLSNIDLQVPPLLSELTQCYDNTVLHTYTTGVDAKYRYSTVLVDGKNFLRLTIVVFYQGGKQQVSLTSLVPIGGL